MKALRIILFLVAILLPGVAEAQVSINKKTNSLSNRTSTTTNNRQQPVDENDTTVTNDTPQGIVYNIDEVPDSVLQSRVFTFGDIIRSVKIRLLQNPYLSPTGIQGNDPLSDIMLGSYTSLGALGQVHQPIFPNIIDKHKVSPFSTQNIFSVNRLLHHSRYFQTQTPYTLLGYGSSLDKDYQIHIVHTQNIKPRWNVAMLYDLVSRDGVYTNSGVTSHFLDLTTNYYSSDARYQMQAALTYNRIRHEENGGVTNDTTCWSYSRESGIPVNMYSAQNQWRDIELRIHQSYNTVRQFPLIVEKDSLQSIIAGGDAHKPYDTIPEPKPSTFNTGVFALDLTYNRNRRLFYDSQNNSWFYNYGSVDTSFYYDSTVYHQLAAELYWTNDAHMQHRWHNPVIVTAGIRPQYEELRFAERNTITSTPQHHYTLSPFASARLHLGRMDLEAHAEETNGSYRTGDYHLDGKISMRWDNSNLMVSLLTEAQSPNMLFYHNEGAYNWDITDYNKIKQQRIAAEYNHNKIGSLRLASTLISDNVWFDSQMRPTQGDATGLLLQGDWTGQLSFGWFNIRTHQMLQHSSDDNVVRVPLYASKNSVFADFYLFSKALRAQIGFDLRYHTKYYCDGWNPVLGAFYRQDEVKVGNYMIADLWLTLQVKRATIYLRASHLNAPIEKLMGFKPHYFSMPHYPYENFTLYWGLVWRFFD